MLALPGRLFRRLDLRLSPPEDRIVAAAEPT
jgi:hypothetical protein